VLFSSQTGDAWVLDPTEQLAARVARYGDPEPICIEDTEASFVIEWKGRYRIEGATFVYTDRVTGRVSAILGYPTDKLAEVLLDCQRVLERRNVHRSRSRWWSKISNMFG